MAGMRFCGDMKKNVLVVAQDAAFRATLARLLAAAGYAIELAEGAKRAREVIAEERVDLGILAVDRLAEAEPQLAWELAAAVGGLILVAESRGALERLPYPTNAHVVTSGDAREILARVHDALPAPVERPAAVGPAPETLCFEGFTLDLPGHVLLDAAGEDVPLTRAEFALLVAFARSPGRVLSRDQLRLAITGEGAEAYDRSIDVTVSRLRRKIEHDPKAPRLILTVPGAGYKFAAKPRVVTAPAAHALVTANSSLAMVEEPAAEQKARASLPWTCRPSAGR
jgi:DNA-binding response OmpR family regulator